MTESSGRLTRRQFVAGGLVAGLALVPGIGSLLWRDDVVAEVEAEAADRLVALVGADAGVAALGRAYLRARDDSPDTMLLVSELLPPDQSPAGITRASDAELRQVLELASTQDFAAERVEVIDGWLLSATETRLAGLVAVTAAT
jgi:hypothetical protein